MINRFKKPILAVILVIGALWLVYANRALLDHSPFQTVYPLKNVSRVVCDAAENYYVITDSRSTIASFDSRGGFRYKILVRDFAETANSLIQDFTVDPEGNLYVLITNPDETGMYVNSESIFRFSHAGKFDRQVYYTEYVEADRPLRVGKIKALQTRGSAICFLHLMENQIWLKTLNPDQQKPSAQLVGTLPANAYMAEIAGTEAKAVYFSTQRGEIYHFAGANQTELIFPPVEADSLKTFPARLRVTWDGKEVCFIDTFVNEIKRLDLANRTLKAESISAQSMIKDISVLSNGTMVAALSSRVIRIGRNGEDNLVFDSARYSAGIIAARAMIWLVGITLLLALIFGLWQFVRSVTQMQVSLRTKQIAVFVPLMVVCMACLMVYLYLGFSGKQQSEVFDKLIVLTRIGQNLLDTGNLERINSPRDYMNADYTALRRVTIEDQMNRGTLGSSYAGTLANNGMYSAIYKLENGKLYAIVDYDNSVNMYRPIDIQNEFNRVLEERQIITQVSSDENGSWMFAMGPLFDKQQNIIGIYETGVDWTSFEQESRRMLIQYLGWGILFITIVVMAAFFVMTYFLLKSVRTLQISVNEIAAGNWDTKVHIETRDEIAELGERFNVMAQYIKNYINDITVLSQSYYRFVPEQFLTFLGKSSVTEVDIGDGISQEMTVLFSDIRSFTDLSEGMSPEENFRFINSYLSMMGPIIRKNGGFIDKYIGDAIMALFPGKPSDALYAAIEMRETLKRFNKQRGRAGEKAINIGIGIHTGSLMLGVVGESERIDGTVIADAVNLASRLEGLTKMYGVGILISETTLEQAPGFDEAAHRFLGRVRVKGKQKPVGIYELYTDFDSLSDAKSRTASDFTQGVSQYIDGCFDSAIQSFERVLAINPNDLAAVLYLDACRSLQAESGSGEWDGAMVFHEK
ncbi:MAG: adenylate/guanylate cyclase domain-containing protein [Solirubrobacterales bacterium]